MTERDTEEVRALWTLFGASDCWTNSTGVYVVESPTEPLTLSALLDVCLILKCKHEELFCDLDTTSGGCPTCGDSPRPELTFRVVRQEGE